MENRQPTYPGRVVLTPVPGMANTYDMTRADEPTVDGTPLNKETLLQDATCAILDIPDTSVPNDAFVKLALGVGKYGYVIHVQYPDGSPAEGFTLTGLNAPDGTAAVTNANGDAVGVSTEQSVTVGIDSPYIDIQDVSGQVVESTGILTEYTVTLDFVDTSSGLQIKTSQSIRLSKFVAAIDLCTVGGGGGGGGGQSSNFSYRTQPYPSGGGGGYSANAHIVDIPSNRTLVIVIGAGGAGGQLQQNGASGGTTTAKWDGSESNLLSSGGGDGGIGSGGTWAAVNGNGNGGYYLSSGSSQTYNPPGDGSVRIFDDPSLPISGGGGGGGCANSGALGPPPGATPYGGNGSSNNPTTAAKNGNGPGGGGGGGYISNYQIINGGSGASGIVYLRTYHQEEV